jgi:hypothetical protein
MNVALIAILFEKKYSTVPPPTGTKSVRNKNVLDKGIVG